MRLPFPALVTLLAAANVTVAVWQGQPSHGYGFVWLLLPAYFWFKRPAHRRRLLWFVGGLAVQTMAYPEIDFGFLGWVVLLPYLAARECDDGASWWRAACLYGFLRAHAGLYWLGSVHFTAWIGVSLGSSLLFVLAFEGVLRWARFLPYALRVATGWVLFEWLHSWFLGGCPWLFLSHSQYAYLPVIQVADLVGAAGISFVMAFAAAAAWRRRLSAEAFVAAGLVVGMLAYGFLREGPEEQQGRPGVLMVQTAVSMSMKEGGEDRDKIWRQAVRLTQEGLRKHPESDLVVWPETIHPIPYIEDLPQNRSRFHDYVGRNARRFRLPFIYGINSFSSIEKLELHRGHNSAIMVDRLGVLGGLYRKQRLVTMGEEFLPRRLFSEELCDRWKRWLERHLAYPSSSDLEAGEGYVVLDAGPGLRCAPLICFEGLYPHMGREALAEGEPDLILHLVNNGWFGHAWEARQSVASWVLRAVETRTPFLSCANGGITCAIDPSGRFLGQVDKVMEEGFLYTEVPVRWRDPLFLRGGQWILPVGLFVACVVFGMRSRSRVSVAKSDPA